MLQLPRLALRLYDADGRCLAQPYEDVAHPEAGLRDEIRIKAYPVEELGGLLWAYLGPELRPLVRQSAPVWQDSVRLWRRPRDCSAGITARSAARR